MPEKHIRQKFSRRAMLKGASTGAIALSSVGITSADDVSNEKARQKLNQSERVQSILSELNHPTVKIGTLSAFRVNEDGKNITGMIVDTGAGRLLYGESKSGDTGAMLQLDTGPDHEVNSKYSEIPSETHPVLLGRKDDAVFRREATENEMRAVKQSIETEINDTAMVYTGSDINGFRVDSAPEEGEETVHRYEVGFNTSISPEKPNLSTMSGAVTPQISIGEAKDAFQDCGAECSSCASSLGTCGKCYFTCAGSPTGVGLILCIFCVKASCEIGSVVGCSFCIDCLQDNGYL